MYQFLQSTCFYLLLLILDRRENKLDLPQIRHHIAEDQWIVILQIEFNAWAECRALREENQVLQLEHALDNLGRRTLCLNLHGRLVVRDDRLLLSEISHAAEDEIGSRTRNLHLLTQDIHVTTDFLEIRAVHVNNAREIQTWDADVLYISIKELEEEVRDLRLLRILHTNAKLVRIVRRQV